MIAQPAIAEKTSNQIFQFSLRPLVPLSAQPSTKSKPIIREFPGIIWTSYSSWAPLRPMPFRNWPDSQCTRGPRKTYSCITFPLFVTALSSFFIESIPSFLPLPLFIIDLESDGNVHAHSGGRE